MQLIDLTGKVFGLLTVLSRAPDIKGRRRWRCSCICGQVKTIEGMALKQGKSRSCGCRQGLIIHGQHKSRTYKSWTTMKARCLNVRHNNYPLYGGRGISICARWQESFENFLADMGPRPKRTTIERRDNNGNYEPSNCYWATHTEQMNNTRRNVYLEFQGQRKSLPTWAVEKGIRRGTLATRIKRGWSIERALTEPVHEKVYETMVAEGLRIGRREVSAA